MSKINLDVSNHPWRCIDTDGTRCPWLRVAKFGSIWTCHLFCEQTDRGQWEELAEREGCIERHPECVKAQVSDE